MTFGARLRQLRRDKGITQEELGEEINLSKGNISKYEAGMFEPNLDTLRLLSQFFECSIDYLLCNADETTTVELREINGYEIIIEKAKDSEVSPEVLQILLDHYLKLHRDK